MGTNYSKTTNFLAKDSLSSGDPAKKVKGADFDTEFNNLALADADSLKISDLGTGVETALGVNVGSAGAPVLFNGAGGTPSSIVLTNATGTAASLTAGTASAVAVGGITGLGTGVATALAVNVGSAGAPVVLDGALGTPSSGALTNCTGVSEDYIYIRDEKTSGTTGQSFSGVATSWVKRDLNTEVNDAGGHASLASSVITLAAGTYRFRFSAPASSTGVHKARLANTSDSTYYYGSSADANGSYGGYSDSIGAGRFTIASSKNFELQHWVTTGTTGGQATSIPSVNEVYSQIEFWKER